MKLTGRIIFLGTLVPVLVGCAGSGLKSKQSLWSPSMPEAISEKAPLLDLRSLEYEIHLEANLVRKKSGKAPLTWSDTIATVARMHSEDMATKGYFGHINKEGETASDRAQKAGIAGQYQLGHFVVQGVGENLFATHRYSEYTVQKSEEKETYDVNWKQSTVIAKEAVEAWLESTGHRKNLLSSAYQTQGIGVALGSNGTIFVTQNLF